MDRDVFAERFKSAAATAREIAQAQVIEDLPAELEFRVWLSQSYDEVPLHPDDVVFPEDGSRRLGAELRRCDFKTVVDELWRDGRVPVWVRLSVAAMTSVSTIIEVNCCGRFTDNEGRLFDGDGRAPFKAMEIRVGEAADGSRFSIHANVSCRDHDDLYMLTAAPDRVQSLYIMTDQFDRQSLAAIPDLPNVKFIWHNACTADLAAFARFPSLVSLRLILMDNSTFHVGAEVRLDALEHLHISNLPNRQWAHPDVPASIPRLNSLILEAKDALWLDGYFPQSFTQLQLEATRLIGSVRLSGSVDFLAVRIAGLTDQDIATLLERNPQISHFILHNTSVTDATLSTLERYWLQSVNVYGTNVTTEALARFQARRPKTRLYPNPGA